MTAAANRAGRPRDADRIARRKAAILKAAVCLFAEAGYVQADIQELADRLGIGKGTVYRYFPTKEALFFAAVDAGMQALTERIDLAVERVADPVAHIKEGVLAYLGYFDEHPELVELLIIERAEFRDRKQATYFIYHERNSEKRRGFIEDAIKAGIIRPIAADRVVEMISDTLYGVIFTNHFARRKVSFEAQAEDVLDILFNGLLSDAYRGSV